MVAALVFATQFLAGHANAQVLKDSSENNVILPALSAKLDLKIHGIADSPVPGLMQIYTDKGLFYVSDDKKYFLQARIYDVSSGIVDETENALKEMRLIGIRRFADSMIEFKAKDEKHVINVFTDYTCGYCRKLHNEMAQYNELGITVRYLAWPRAGINSTPYNNMVSIWCAENQQAAMNGAKAGESILPVNCENNIAEQFSFGRQIGVSGTPNIILSDGSVIPGYRPANEIALMLEQ